MLGPSADLGFLGHRLDGGQPPAFPASAAAAAAIVPLMAWLTRASAIRGSTFSVSERKMLSLRRNSRSIAVRALLSSSEVRQPVRSLALAVDRVGQPPLFPQPVGQQFAAVLLQIVATWPDTPAASREYLFESKMNRAS